MSNFNSKAKSWDLKSRRVQNAKNIANEIEISLPFKKNMTIADLGAGTGLLSYFLSHLVSKVVAIDNSRDMLEVFLSKSNSFKCEIEAIKRDISLESIDLNFDAIVSSMTIHHIKDTKELLSKLYKMLNSNGYIALADLEIEDGSFHSDNSGVYHFGFEFNSLANIAKEIGFKDIEIKSCNPIIKPNGEYRVSILIAKK